MKMSSLLLWLRAIKARAYVRVIGGNRELSWVITEVGLPVISLSAYIFIYRSLGAPRIYEGLVVLGGAMIPFWVGVLWSMATQFYWEKEMGNLDLFMASPMPPTALLLGMAIGGMFMSLMRTLFVIVVGVLIFHVQLSIHQPGLLTLVFLLTMTSLFSLGMAASSAYFMVGRVGMRLNQILMEPIYLLSGLYFPVTHLGRILVAFAALIPLTLGLDGVRQLVLVGGASLGFLSPRTEALALAAMTTVFTFGAVRLMRLLEQQGKQRGTMSLRWQ
jgi:ABC-2 type transport system permease protein